MRMAGRRAPWMVAVALAGLLIVGGCSDDKPATQNAASQLPGNNSIGDRAAEQQGSRAFIQLAAESEVLRGISDLKEATLFLPSEAGLEQLKVSRPEYFSDPNLKSVLAKYFTVSSKLSKEQLKGATKLTSLAGLPLRVEVVGEEIRVGGVKVSGDPIEARNGLVYQLDGAIEPPSVQARG